MKILSSSPYAAFSPKEWHKATRSCSTLNTNLPVRIKKVYYQSSKVFLSNKILQKDFKNSNFIQLSFA
tara:strand:- start:268 stop:471 length:204 start_codon:yes stop_codon:yes gene_type:complete